MLLTDVIIGLQHGDEGKGKIAYNILKRGKYSYCIRFNGGPNAGHSIKDKEKNIDIVLHQVPCGVLFGITSIIGSGCVVDLLKLQTELEYLENKGFSDIRTHLFLAFNAHVIGRQHIMLDNDSIIGTTGSGIGPCYSDKCKRIGKRCIDFQKTIESMKLQLINPLSYFASLPSHVKYEVLCEGAQGFSLDIDWGDYPYCTSSSCIASCISTSGIPYKSIRCVYGCCKLYDTYVGNKDFQPKNNELLETLAEAGQEFGSTTGRKRQCNWLDIDTLKQAIFINGCTHVIANKCDIIEKSGAFVIDGKKFNTFQDMKNCFEKHVHSVAKDIQILYSYSPYVI